VKDLEGALFLIQCPSVGSLVQTFSGTQRSDLDTFGQISGYMLLSSGALYAAMGLLCLQHLKMKKSKHKALEEQAAAEIVEKEIIKRDLRTSMNGPPANKGSARSQSRWKKPPV